MLAGFIIGSACGSECAGDNLYSQNISCIRSCAGNRLHRVLRIAEKVVGGRWAGREWARGIVIQDVLFARHIGKVNDNISALACAKQQVAGKGYWVKKPVVRMVDILQQVAALGADLDNLRARGI